MTWRERYAPLIAKIIREVGTSDKRALRQALREAFPSGPREYHPYKIWLDEIRVQLGEKPLKVRRKGDRGKLVPADGQGELFQ